MNRILHADLDAFYASVEQRDDPTLRGKPVIVGGGVVLAASYEARRFGIRTAMNGGQAKALCPRVLVVEPRMEAYSEASKAVFEIFNDTSPWVEGLSIDEAFIDVTGLRRLVGPDTEIAKALRRRVAAEVGLPISVGGGSTKFLAKVASGVAKPNGVRIVANGDELAFLHPLPVSRLWGVGPVTEERLAGVGLRTVADVAAIERKRLVSLCGKAAGHHLYALAHNLDPRQVEVGRRRRSVGSQRSFPANSVDRDGAEGVLLETVDRVTRRLRTGHRVCRTVVLRLRFGDFAQATRSRTLVEATNSTGPILSTAQDLLDESWPTISERGLTKVGIAVTGLCSDDAIQLPLPFAKADGPAIDRAVDTIRQRFGTDSLTRTTLVGRPSIDMPLLPD
ncbi:MAG: DNA polymerase IV [Actinomycetia bacterium]|nr:DNA polymerase IV [Actinomycetes bacterium]MCP5034010.1 DNA polymerase IV [Actinomycetes bacterium]